MLYDHIHQEPAGRASPQAGRAGHTRDTELRELRGGADSLGGRGGAEVVAAQLPELRTQKCECHIV